MNGIKHSSVSSNPRQNKTNIPNNRPPSAFDTGVSKWTNNIDNPNFTNPANRQNVTVGASGDNSGNSQLNNSDKSTNSYSGSNIWINYLQEITLFLSWNVLF